MKPEIPAEQDPALSGLLHEWKVASAAAPGFEDNVWRRIAQTQRQPAISLVSLLRDWIAQSFARPSVAIGYAAILLITGVSAGFWQGHQISTHGVERVSVRYVQMMDAFEAPR
jgi:hypothetical protein